MPFELGQTLETRDVEVHAIDRYRGGRLKLDELLTRTYLFAEISAAYDAIERGEVARSVVLFS